LLAGIIDGGTGSDGLEVTLAGVQNGQIEFKGGTGTNRLLLLRGGSTYEESYVTSNVGGEFLFTNAGNNFGITFSEVSNIHDNASASLTVLGTVENDDF